MAANKNNDSTRATAQLRKHGVEFALHEFIHAAGERNYGLVAAQSLGVDAGRVFKTLLATVDGLAAPGVAVGIVPVSGQLSLKELAQSLDGKRAEMCDPVVAERLTGYVVGGISPFGQKKRLPTAIDESCRSHESIFVSGGKRGLEIEIAPDDLLRVLSAVVARLAITR